jgi:hypothetical protein
MNTILWGYLQAFPIAPYPCLPAGRLTLPRPVAVPKYEKNQHFERRGEAATISHNLKDPHSKALEPDCLSPLLAVTTQSPEGEGC